MRVTSLHCKVDFFVSEQQNSFRQTSARFPHITTITKKRRKWYQDSRLNGRGGEAYKGAVPMNQDLHPVTCKGIQVYSIIKLNSDGIPP